MRESMNFFNCSEYLLKKFKIHRLYLFICLKNNFCTPQYFAKKSLETRVPRLFLGKILRGSKNYHAACESGDDAVSNAYILSICSLYICRSASVQVGSDSR